ncbi:hypothetical protein D3C86_2096500 [compost metagenome]
MNNQLITDRQVVQLQLLYIQATLAHLLLLPRGSLLGIVIVHIGPGHHVNPCIYLVRHRQRLAAFIGVRIFL